MNMNIKKLFAVTLAALVLARCHAQEINIEQGIDVFGRKPVPISLTGFSGEALEVLKFDLYVQGFKFVSPGEAVYQVNGSSGGAVSGTLTFSKQVKFSKQYSGGSLRRQAHALADDIVLEVTGAKGIGMGRIAYKSQIANGDGEIFIGDFDGHGAEAATSDNAIVAKPAWVPSKMALLYTSYAKGNPNIFFHNLATGKRRAFADYPGLNTSAAVSPDGTKVAMILGKDGRPSLYVADIDGKNVKRLTTGPEDSSPCWSPNGDWICFASNMKGRRRLAKISANGGEPIPFNTSGMSSPSEPDWSPDGKWIAFTRLAGNFDVCVMSADGKIPPQVVAAGQNPAWAANSRTLAYNHDGGRGQVLSVLDVFTKQYKDCARAAGSNSQPAWAK